LPAQLSSAVAFILWLDGLAIVTPYDVYKMISEVAIKLPPGRKLDSQEIPYIIT
jgi:hypothetical protein